MISEIKTDPFTLQRERMVQSQLRARGIGDERVLAAMTRVSRHEFVPEEYREQAYEDHPIPIGEGQTLSQPYIVAIMLESLALTPFYKVLEIGTGSGYQTALLSELTQQVCSVERHAPLALAAKDLLARLGCDNAKIIVADGSSGLPDHAPFDSIVVSAAAPRVPMPLFDQLREGGRMIIPVGPPAAQQLKLVRKQGGQPIIVTLEGCRFVPLIGDQGYRSG